MASEREGKAVRMYDIVWVRICRRLDIDRDACKPIDVIERLTDEEICELVDAWWRG